MMSILVINQSTVSSVSAGAIEVDLRLCFVLKAVLYFSIIPFFSSNGGSAVSETV